MRKLKEIQTASWKKPLTRFTAVVLCSAMLAGTVVVPKNSVLADETVEDTEGVADKTPEPDEIVEAEPQTIKLKNSSKSYTADKFITKKQTFKIGASAKTELSYEVTKGSEYISVNGQGVVTIKKGTPAGNYEISVTAEATDEYEQATKTVKIKVESHMKNAYVKWDLKKNKTVKYKTAYIGYSPIMKNGTLTIKDYKIKNAKKSGYKQLTFRVDFNRPASFSKKELKEIGGCLNADEWMSPFGGNEYVTLVDYETGECLEHKNAYNVTAKFGKWDYSGTKKTFQLSGGSFWIMPKGSIKVTVTYPKSYKNLCIVAGGYSNNDGKYDDPEYTKYMSITVPGMNSVSDYFKGKKKQKCFAQATPLYSKKYKTVAHAMRVK